jgi:hypothetical protein
MNSVPLTIPSTVHTCCDVALPFLRVMAHPPPSHTCDTIVNAPTGTACAASPFPVRVTFHAASNVQIDGSP